MKKFKVIFVILIIVCVAIYVYLFYPKQYMEVGERLKVITPDSIYKNDCLHPCIRDFGDNKFCGKRYWMVQSPYYAGNNKIENPILYSTNNLQNWNNGLVVAETPKYGYNSDPYIFREDSLLFVFWRECGTPFCDSLKVNYITVGKYTIDGVNFSDKKVYLTNKNSKIDTEQAPVLMSLNDRGGGEAFVYVLCSMVFV